MLIRRLSLSTAGFLMLSVFAAVNVEPQANLVKHQESESIKTRPPAAASTEVGRHAEKGLGDPCGVTKSDMENYGPPTTQQIQAVSKVFKEAESGTAKSQLELANAYCETRAYVDADMWYRVAQAGSDTRVEASRRSKALETSVMTSLGIAEAQFRAEQWQVAHSNRQPQDGAGKAKRAGGPDGVFDLATIAFVLSVLALVLTLIVFAFVRTSTRRALRDAGLL